MKSMLADCAEILISSNWKVKGQAGVNEMQIPHAVLGESTKGELQTLSGSIVSLYEFGFSTNYVPVNHSGILV